MKAIQIQAANLCFDPSPNTLDFFLTHHFLGLVPNFTSLKLFAILGMIQSQKSKLFVFNDFGQVTRVMQTTDGETGSTRSGLWQASGKDDV